MATDKLFTVAGTARNADGTVKARFANDLVARIKILNKAGCTDINLIELPQPMTKLAALEYLQSQGITEGDAGYAVANKLAEKSRVARRGEVKMTVSTGSSKSTKSTKSTKPATTKGARAVQLGLVKDIDEAREVLGDEFDAKL